jgi:threonyl-tRNA synthetase
MTPDQIEDEIVGVLKLVERIYGTFGLGFHLELSTRPEKSIGTDQQWETVTKGLKSALAIYGQDYKINEGDGAFYGPKIDMHIKDALGRTWQCGTVQLDMALPERFDLYYIGKDNEKHRPFMIHRVVYGSIERFLGILIEHFAGKFPLWLTPIQAVVLAINDEIVPYARTVKMKLENAGLRIELDGRTESLNRKVRDAQLSKIPLILTIGKKEKESDTLSVRTLEGNVQQGISHKEFLSRVKKHIIQKNLDLDIFSGS